MIKKIFKMIAWLFIAIILVIFIASTLFIKLNPHFGGKANSVQKEQYAKSGYYKEGKFLNTLETKMEVEYGKVMREFMKKDPSRRPLKPLEPVHQDSADIANWNLNQDQLIWFGHSSFLIQIDGEKILLDPMFGNSPSPVPAIGTKRFSKSLPISPEKLPTIDAVVLSHDHYDHLDYNSIKILKNKVKKFYVPLGVDNHLIAWGVDSSKIHVMKWWDEALLDSVKLVFTPSRHFSGRALFDRNATLWGSWVIKGKRNSVFFSGDGGYGPHFTEIGQKYGSFDVALVECGQYNEQWHDIHMMPEESAQAAKDLQSKVMIPIHWGAFTLGLHSWTEPVERALVKASQLNLPVITPQIGEQVILDSIELSNTHWWEK